MEKMWTASLGIILVLLGAMALAVNVLFGVLGFSLPWLAPWRFWPLLVLGVGSLLLLGALGSLRRPALGALFIPAVPVSVVGLILLFASVFQQWHIWSFAWSFVVLSIAVGFLLAMVFSRTIWYGIPAILIGLNGLVLTFCSLTGLWSWWSVLWTVEPLAIGLILLLISLKTRSAVLVLLGLAACSFATIAFLLMSGTMFFLGGGLFRVTGPILLVLLGLLMLGWSFVRRSINLQLE